MIGRPGSTLWLLAAEMRLGLRDSLGRIGRTRAIVLTVAALVLVFALGLPAGVALRRTGIPVVPLSIVVGDIICAVVFTLMLSQTLSAATLALYGRGDLDLLFSSPIAPRKVLAVRFAAIAANVFAAFAMLAVPLMLPIALLGHWRWLGALLVLADLALAASACGLLLATALFGLLGPRRTRTVAQVLAALVGAAFFLASQAHSLLGGARSSSLWLSIARAVGDGRLILPPGASWPLRAMLGEPGPLAGMTAGGAALFLGASQWLGGRFARNAAAASGIDLAGKTRRSRDRGRPFAQGALAATFRKELRLLWRDAALLSQVFLRVLYLLPLAFLLLRQAHGQMTYALPAGAAALAMMTGQVSGSLAWVTVSAEDAPELLAASPTPVGLLLRAKLAAALTPVAVMLAAPLVVLIALSPQTGVVAAAGCAGCAVASALINAWYNKPARRTDFRRRRSGSLVAGIAQLLVTGMIAVATAIAAAPSIWGLSAIVPALVALGALFALRRTDSQMAEALRSPA
ncbi:hypothetical protein ACO2Q3_09120 [Caulobacter sp. KR2-114]|uniref:hypothetical protein n=1 Tax=Caulobacter sp. KR2-114 TaxID=3400912 RepID=UPI003C0B1C89